MAAVTLPVPLLQCEARVDRSTHMASLAGRRPPVNFHDGGAGVAGHPFQDGHELCKSEVGNFPPPQALHPIEIEVLDADDGILAHKLVCQFEEPIAPAVADALVDTLQVTNRTPAVSAALLAAGYRTVSYLQLFERGFVPLGRIYHRAVIQIEEMLQSKIHPDSFTCSWKDVVVLLPGDDDEIDFAQRIALYGERFDSPLHGAGFAILVFSPHDGDTVAVVESISRLFQCEAGIPAPLLKRWRRLSTVAFLLHMVKERFIGAVDPLNNILNGLATEGFPFRVKRFLDLGDVFHQPVGRKMFSERFIVVAVHGNAVVPDGGGNVDTVIQIFILFALIELEFVRLYNGSHVVASFLVLLFVIPPNLYMPANANLSAFHPTAYAVGFLGRVR